MIQRFIDGLLIKKLPGKNQTKLDNLLEKR